MTGLDSGDIARVLKRLFKEAEDDEQNRVRGSTEIEESSRENSYLSVSPASGRLLYILARTCRRIVEFGTSFGISTIHLAAAARENGHGSRVLSTELVPKKAQRARENLSDAGLSGYADILEGDAVAILQNIDFYIDMLFLDGRRDLYLPVLKLAESRLRKGAIVVADDVRKFPEELKSYLAYVRNPESGCISVELPVDDGLELSLRG
ncbi:MAG: class I SAM-dependent methyltransferase [Candidatus Acidiferrales bacterium]